jgi:hypothetical protein
VAGEYRLVDFIFRDDDAGKGKNGKEDIKLPIIFVSALSSP